MSVYVVLTCSLVSNGSPDDMSINVDSYVVRKTTNKQYLVEADICTLFSHFTSHVLPSPHFPYPQVYDYMDFRVEMTKEDNTSSSRVYQSIFETCQFVYYPSPYQPVEQPPFRVISRYPPEQGAGRRLKRERGGIQVLSRAGDFNSKNIGDISIVFEN